jgi:hypothetical protein
MVFLNVKVGWGFFAGAIVALGLAAGTANGEEAVGSNESATTQSATTEPAEKSGATSQPIQKLSLEGVVEPEIPPGTDLPHEAEPVVTAEPTKPFSLAVNYWLYSDYISRGVNCSEYAGEGRERLNHQLGTSLNVPVGKNSQYGTFGFDTWFEWYGGQEAFETTQGGTNLQEVDYTLRWSYDIAPIKTTATIAWTEFTYPHLKNVGSRDWTDEVSLRLNHNDAWLWRWTGYQGDAGILNPSLFIARDFRMAKGWWLEAGFNHPFALSKNVTWTPNMTLAFDGKYIEPFLGAGPGSWQYAYTQFGYELKYDLTQLLHLPPQAGSVYVSQLLYYNLASEYILHDELFGGLSLGWAW